MNIPQRLQTIRETLPDDVRLVAVSKYHPAESIQAAYEAGQRDFGESRAQELVGKHALLPSDIRWHFIGHLQPNKVKYIAPFVSLIHAVDSLKLLREIDRQGCRCGRIIPCLLQLHVAAETTKYGFTPDECLNMLAQGEWRNLTHAQISGLMCMATNTDDAARIDSDFAAAQNLYNLIRRNYFADAPDFCLRSWGMSDDYPVAIARGANIVRIGSAIFGERE